MRYVLFLIIFSSYHVINAMLTINQFQQKFPSLSEKATAYGIWDKYPTPAEGTSEFFITLMSIQQTQIHDLEYQLEGLKTQNKELRNDLSSLKNNSNISEHYSLKVIKQLTPSFDTFFFGCFFGAIIYCSYKIFNLATLETIGNSK